MLNLSTRFSNWLVTVLSLMLFSKNKLSKKHSAFTQDSEEFLSNTFQTESMTSSNWFPYSTTPMFRLNILGTFLFLLSPMNEYYYRVWSYFGFTAKENNGGYRTLLQYLEILKSCYLTNQQPESIRIQEGFCGRTLKLLRKKTRRLWFSRKS